MSPEIQKQAIRLLCKTVNETAVKSGFWAGDHNFAEKIALTHSELSEALEGHRNSDPPDQHLPHLRNVVVELADAVIRIFDLCEAHEYDLGEAILAKMAYNATRPYKHGKKY